MTYKYVDNSKDPYLNARASFDKWRKKNFVTKCSWCSKFCVEEFSFVNLTKQSKCCGQPIKRHRKDKTDEV